MPMSNYPGGFMDGVNIMGVPILNTYGGKVFWVSSGSGSDGNPGTFARPFATIDYAIGKCTAYRGDIILVKPNYSETLTASITLDVANVSIIGLGAGKQLPSLVGNGTIDAITMTAAGCTVANLSFGVPGTDNQTADINIAAQGCSVFNTRHQGSQNAKNKVDIITLEAAAIDCLIDGIRVYNDVVECNSAIKLEGTCGRVEVRNCCILDAIGFTNGAIYDAATATNLYIHHCIFSNAKANTVVAAFSNNSTGVMSQCFINGRNTTIQSNVTPGTGMAFHEVYGVEEAAKNGILMPVADSE